MIKFTHRRKVIAAVNLGAAFAMSGLFAGAASASTGGTTASANAILIGSGSATSYTTMSSMDQLFNESEGCYTVDNSGITQTLDYSCPPAADTAPPPNVSSTYAPYPDFASSPGYTENPENDIAVEETPYGSSTGIKQLETSSGLSSCSSTNPTVAVNYARSSRIDSSSDCKGLNFVAYAADGVSYFTYPEVNGHATPSAAAANMTTNELTDAYNGSLECWNDPMITSGATSPTLTYSSTGCEPIILYSAQSGSGTLSTWTTFVGVNPQSYLSSINGDTIPNVQQVNGTDASEIYNSNDHIILENEDRQLVSNGDEANALFFFSYGKFSVTCAKAQCGQISGATGTTTEALGSINGVAPGKTSILCGAGVQTTGCTSFFSPTRFLYNVYGNGSNANIPEATPQTLNYVSEDGFMCKPNTTAASHGVAVVDPNTGKTYRTEISNVITGQGFFPLPYQTDEGVIDHNATTLLKAYHTANPTNTYDGEIWSVDTIGQGLAHSTGYCLVYTTDGNSNS